MKSKHLSQGRRQLALAPNPRASLPAKTGETLPAGRYEGEMAVPAGNSPVEGGQTIGVNVNTNTQLSTKDWLIRSVLGAIGKALAFPFRLLAAIVETIFEAIIGILKIAAIVILVPTLIWLGFLLKDMLSEAESVEEGAGIFIEAGKSAATGAGDALAK